MWKEKPMSSSLSSRRALSQPLDLTLRSVLRMSLELRTIIAFSFSLFGGDAVAAGQHRADACLKNVETGRENGVVDGERREHLDDFVMRAAGFDDQPVRRSRRW